jgi:hypothetical protein
MIIDVNLPASGFLPMNRAEVQRVYDVTVAAVSRNRLDVRLPSLYERVTTSSSAPCCGSPIRGKGKGGGGIAVTSKAKTAAKKAGAKKESVSSPPPKQRHTVSGLMLVFFAARLGKVSTKTELVDFLRAMKCPTLDPQPRHLGMQVGLNFIVQGCYHPRAKRALRRGEYCLLDLKRSHPSHASMHRAKALPRLSWEPLKLLYGGRCACCGSVEGERHLKNAHLITTLERGHCDPRRPLTDDNCVPMCKLCNMVYKDKAVISRRGFVVKWLGGDAVDDEETEKEAAEGSAASDSASAIDDTVVEAEAPGASSLGLVAGWCHRAYERLTAALAPFVPVLPARGWLGGGLWRSRIVWGG